MQTPQKNATLTDCVFKVARRMLLYRAIFIDSLSLYVYFLLLVIPCQPHLGRYFQNSLKIVCKRIPMAKGFYDVYTQQ